MGDDRTPPQTRVKGVGTQQQHLLGTLVGESQFSMSYFESLIMSASQLILPTTTDNNIYLKFNI